MTSRRYEISDFEWAIIAPLLPNKPRGGARAEDRRVLHGIYWSLRTGSPWADIPERYGPYTSCSGRKLRTGMPLATFQSVASCPGETVTKLTPICDQAKPPRCRHFVGRYRPTPSFHSSFMSPVLRPRSAKITLPKGSTETLHQHRQPVNALSHIGPPAGEINANPGTGYDHALFSAASTRPNAA
jgi:hypothetical protein